MYEQGKQESEQAKAKEMVDYSFQQQKGIILWSGYSAQKFAVKITTYSRSGNMFLTGEETLNDIVWAKLSLEPTIGSLPLLRYIEKDQPGQIKTVACSGAEII
jgi:hypothetical protein